MVTVPNGVWHMSSLSMKFWFICCLMGLSDSIFIHLVAAAHINVWYLSTLEVSHGGDKPLPSSYSIRNLSLYLKRYCGLRSLLALELISEFQKFRL